MSVEDNGAGIEEEHQESVFELFNTSKSGGIGVEVWLSTAVVTAHGGKMGFSSKLTEGSRFEVVLSISGSMDAA